MSSWKNSSGWRKSIKLGNPLDDETEMGPLTSKMHLDRVLNYIDVCKKEGNKILSGGKQPDDSELKNGYYLEPTVVEARPGDTVFQQEVFGPFVSVTRFKDDAEALELSNATDYGLGQRAVDQQPATRPPVLGRHQGRHGLGELLQTGTSGLPLWRSR